MHDTVLRHRETPHRYSHRVIGRSLVPSDLETSSLNKHQLKLFEQLGNDYKKMRSEYQAYKKMRSEYQAQVIDRSLVPKKMMTNKMMGDFELHILCLDLSRAGGILTNNFDRHGAVRCRKAKQRGELDWWVDNLHDVEWEFLVVLDNFFTCEVVNIINIYVCSFLLFFFWVGYPHCCVLYIMWLFIIWLFTLNQA